MSVHVGYHVYKCSPSVINHVLPLISAANHPHTSHTLGPASRTEILIAIPMFLIDSHSQSPLVRVYNMLTLVMLDRTLSRQSNELITQLAKLVVNYIFCISLCDVDYIIQSCRFWSPRCLIC